MIRLSSFLNSKSNPNSTCKKCNKDKNEDSSFMTDETTIFKGSRFGKILRNVMFIKDDNSYNNDNNIYSENNDGEKESGDGEKESGDRLNEGQLLLSPDGLCLSCEIVEYPGRFHGCAFCRKPLRNMFSCTICRQGFTNWIITTILSEHMNIIMLRKRANKLANKIIESGYIQNKEFIYRESQSFLDTEWPGFYAGVLNLSAENIYYPTWIVPKTLNIRVLNSEKNKDETDSMNLISFIKSKFSEKYLLDILEDNGIYLYNHVQIDMKKFDRENILRSTFS